MNSQKSKADVNNPEKTSKASKKKNARKRKARPHAKSCPTEGLAMRNQNTQTSFWKEETQHLNFPKASNTVQSQQPQPGLNSSSMPKSSVFSPFSADITQSVSEVKEGKSDITLPFSVSIVAVPGRSTKVGEDQFSEIAMMPVEDVLGSPPALPEGCPEGLEINCQVLEEKQKNIIKMMVQLGCSQEQLDNAKAEHQQMLDTTLLLMKRAEDANRGIPLSLWDPIKTELPTSTLNAAAPAFSPQTVVAPKRPCIMPDGRYEQPFRPEPIYYRQVNSDFVTGTFPGRTATEQQTPTKAEYRGMRKWFEPRFKFQHYQVGDQGPVPENGYLMNGSTLRQSQQIPSVGQEDNRFGSLTHASIAPGQPIPARHSPFSEYKKSEISSNRIVASPTQIQSKSETSSGSNTHENTSSRNIHSEAPNGSLDMNYRFPEIYEASPLNVAQNEKTPRKSNEISVQKGTFMTRSPVERGRTNSRYSSSSRVQTPTSVFSESASSSQTAIYHPLTPAAKDSATNTISPRKDMVLAFSDRHNYGSELGAMSTDPPLERIASASDVTSQNTTEPNTLQDIDQHGKLTEDVTTTIDLGASREASRTAIPTVAANTSSCSWASIAKGSNETAKMIDLSSQTKTPFAWRNNAYDPTQQIVVNKQQQNGDGQVEGKSTAMKISAAEPTASTSAPDVREPSGNAKLARTEVAPKSTVTWASHLRSLSDKTTPAPKVAFLNKPTGTSVTWPDLNPKSPTPIQSESQSRAASGSWVRPLFPSSGNTHLSNRDASASAGSKMKQLPSQLTEPTSPRRPVSAPHGSKDFGPLTRTGVDTADIEGDLLPNLELVGEILRPERTENVSGLRWSEIVELETPSLNKESLNLRQPTRVDACSSTEARHIPAKSHGKTSPKSALTSDNWRSTASPHDTSITPMQDRKVDTKSRSKVMAAKNPMFKPSNASPALALMSLNKSDATRSSGEHPHGAAIYKGWEIAALQEAIPKEYRSICPESLLNPSGCPHKGACKLDFVCAWFAFGRQCKWSEKKEPCKFPHLRLTPPEGSTGGNSGKARVENVTQDANKDEEWEQVKGKHKPSSSKEERVWDAVQKLRVAHARGWATSQH